MEVVTEGMKWKRCVPNSYWDTVTCHYLKDDGSTAYVCTNGGVFLECRNGVIEKSLLLACENANCITHFLTYHPYAEYFIVTEGEKLAIISNGKDLSIFWQHNNVKKHEIRDFKCEGYPQIKIWPNRDVEDPFIVDFSAKKGSPIGGTLPEVQISPEDHNNEVFTAMLEPKLKEAKGLIASYIHKLAHKKRLRAETIARLLNDNLPDADFQTLEKRNLVNMMETSESYDTKEADFKRNIFSPNVCFLYPWQTAVDKFWILGVFVKNTSKRVLSDFKITLYKGRKENFSYSTKRISAKDIQEVNNRLELKYQALPPKPIAVWNEEMLDEKLPPGKGFFLITKFLFPDFVTKPSIAVQGKLSYSIVNKEGKSDIFHQDYPTFNITAQNVVNGSIITESPHESFFQCLSTIALSKAGVVTVNTKMSGTKSVEDILVKSIGFTAIGEDNLFLFSGNGKNALFGSVVQAVEVSDIILQLHLYPKNPQLSGLLLHTVLEALPGSWNLTYSRSAATHEQNDERTLDQCMNALSDEISFIHSYLSQWKRNNDEHKLHIDLPEYKEFKKKLSHLQKETDKAFNYNAEDLHK